MNLTKNEKLKQPKQESPMIRILFISLALGLSAAAANG